MAFWIPLMAAGGLLQAGGSIMGGNAALAEAEASAAQLRYNAGQQRAAGHRAGQNEIRQSEVLMSKMLAMAGASGAGAYDPTMINLFAQADAEGKLASQTQIYNAEEAARGMEADANAAIRSGRAKKRAGQIGALGSLLSTGGQMAYNWPKS